MKLYIHRYSRVTVSLSLAARRDSVSDGKRSASSRQSSVSSRQSWSPRVAAGSQVASWRRSVENDSSKKKRRTALKMRVAQRGKEEILTKAKSIFITWLRRSYGSVWKCPSIQMLQFLRVSLSLFFCLSLILTSQLHTFTKEIKVKLATLVEGDLRCRGGCYSIPWMASLYPWSLPNNAEC